MAPTGIYVAGISRGGNMARPEVILPVGVAAAEKRFQARLELIVFQAVQLVRDEPAVVVAVQMSEHPPDLALATDREVTWKRCKNEI